MNRLIIFIVILLLSCNQKKETTKPGNAVPKDSISIAPKNNEIPDSLKFKSSQDSLFINTSATKIKLKPISISLQKGIDFNLSIPEGYNASIAFEGLKRPRFLARAPGEDDRLFITDLQDKSDNRRGQVLLLSEWDSQSKKYKRIDIFLDKLHNPNQVAFYQGFMYVAETGRLSRYKYEKGNNKPTSEPQVLITFPDYGLSYKYGGWHLTRSLAFHNSKIYVSIGSSCNACIEKETMRAAVLEMNPDGSEMVIYASGLRNSVGIKWIGNKLWATGMGRDLIGPDKPEDLFQEIKRGQYYGWPFYFQYRGIIYEDEQFRDSMKGPEVKKPPIAFSGFKAHSAPLGFDYFEGFDDTRLDKAILVALHGSTSVWRQRGNSVVKINGGNNYQEVVSGFLQGKTEKERYGRPCDVMMKDSRSFFITDDHNGVLYYIYKN